MDYSPPDSSVRGISQARILEWVATTFSRGSSLNIHWKDCCWSWSSNKSWSSNTLENLMWRADSLEKTLMLGKIEGRRRRERQRTMWLDSIIDSMDMNVSELWEIAEDKGAWRGTVHGVKKSWTRLSNWTTATTMCVIIVLLLLPNISKH